MEEPYKLVIVHLTYIPRECALFFVHSLPVVARLGEFALNKCTGEIAAEEDRAGIDKQKVR